ncbi:MAG TPA: ABC transporter substrate-binding protein [Gemmatimonadaceae bacterium]|nr:ABC transporter substrate-binding protein [Gemmatimonadaceae bacterium]
MRNRRISLVALVAFIACTGGESSPARRTLIDSRDTYDPRSLDPALSTDVPTGRAVAYMFDGLARFTPDAQIVPGLAREWSVSNDGLTYTFHLRTGVKFSDGRPFVARQVVSSFMRALDPATKGGRGWPLYPIAGAKDYADGKAKSVSGLTVQNDSTIVIRLTEPFAIFPKLLAMPVASIIPDSVPSNFGEHPVGTGPWKFVEWKHDDYLLFAKNPNYWGTAPKADSLRARIIPEPSTAVAEFEAGNVDVLYVPEAETRNWEDTDDKKAMLESAPALRMLYVAINTTRGPLADPRVRQAMNYAVDNRAILNSIMSGRGNVATGVIPPSLPGGDSTRKGYTHDVAKAKQLLAAAGKTGATLELWSSQTAPFPRIAQAIQANLNEAGFNVKLVQRDASSMREAARAGKTDMALKDWFADYPDGEDFLYPLLHSANKGVGGNVSFYANPKFDQLVSSARRELDDAKRTGMYKQADQMAYDDAPMIYLFFYKELYAVQPWITGFKVPSIFTGQNWTDVSIKRQQ